VKGKAISKEDGKEKTGDQFERNEAVKGNMPFADTNKANQTTMNPFCNPPFFAPVWLIIVQKKGLDDPTTNVQMLKNQKTT